jgi:DNA replication factor GINS
MTEINITYETLYEILRREKNRAELQELDELFYQKLVTYIKEKYEILRSQEQKDSIFTTIEVQKTRKQIENIQKITKELYEKRESKIIQIALINSRTKSSTNDKKFMLNLEKNVYDKVIQNLDKFRVEILHNVILGKLIETTIVKNEPKDLKKVENPKNQAKEVVFKQKMSKFVGTDLNNYGPYEKGDIAQLPEDVTTLLIKKNQVEEKK